MGGTEPDGRADLEARVDELTRERDALAEELRHTRSRTDEALRHREERFRILIEALPDMIAIVDAEGRLQYQSPSVHRVLGYPPGEIQGRSLFGLIHPDDLPEVRKRFGEVLGGRLPHRLECRMRHADGSWRYVEGGSRNHLETEAIGGILIVGWDATARHHLEETLRHSQKMEAVGTLAGGVAHDFNNLLTAIVGYADLLASAIPAGDSRREAVDEIRKAGDRAASLTRQLLAFSRRQVLAPKVLDLNAAVAGLEKLLRRVIGEDVEIAIEKDPALGRIKADPGQVEQVVLNLVVNSRDALPEGGRVVIATRRVTLPDPRFPFEAPPGVYALLEVSDNGTGMDEATKRRVFEPFFTTKPTGKGTGLGLSTAYGIVGQSGGHITFRSEPGRGTTFWVLFPETGERAAASGPSGVFRVPRGHEAVLLVEDDDAVRSLVGRMLEANGYRVRLASGGDEAVRLAEDASESVDLLLTDMVMPGLSWSETARRVRARHPEARVLVMSGYADRERAVETPFIPKPFTQRALLAAVREALASERGR